jgi:hypothetical protein
MLPAAVKRLALVLLLLFVLAACQRDDGGQQATATTATVPVETTSATTTTKPPDAKRLGVTQKHTSADGSAGNVTVFRYRDDGVLPGYLEAEVRKEGKRTVAIEARICITAKSPDVEGEITLSWGPWSVGDDSGGSYEAWTSYHDSLLVQPPYPDGDKATPVGTCRRGWIPFEIARDMRPTFIEYNPGDGNILKWPIKR